PEGPVRRMTKMSTGYSGQTEEQRLIRQRNLDFFRGAIDSMLEEKLRQYGHTGGFYDTNSMDDYTHALGEAKLKIAQFAAKRDLRDLVKAATWLYLIYKMEKPLGS